MKYCVYKEDDQYVSQCLNVDVASCGDTVEEAVKNLREAVELYLEDAGIVEYQKVDEVMIGESLIHA